MPDDAGTPAALTATAPLARHPARRPTSPPRRRCRGTASACRLSLCNAAAPRPAPTPPTLAGRASTTLPASVVRQRQCNTAPPLRRHSLTCATPRTTAAGMLVLHHRRVDGTPDRDGPLAAVLPAAAAPTTASPAGQPPKTRSGEGAGACHRDKAERTRSLWRPRSGTAAGAPHPPRRAPSYRSQATGRQSGCRHGAAVLRHLQAWHSPPPPHPCRQCGTRRRHRTLAAPPNAAATRRPMKQNAGSAAVVAL